MHAVKNANNTSITAFVYCATVRICVFHLFIAYH